MRHISVSIAMLLLTPIAATAAEQPGKNKHMDHNAMSQSASESIAMASGTVKKINLESGMMVIAHGPVETLGWPPMTMSFKASPDLMRDLKEGDVIEFEFTSSGMHSTIISIEKM